MALRMTGRGTSGLVRFSKNGRSNGLEYAGSSERFRADHIDDTEKGTGMALVTVRYLQRECGLPILKASTLINEHRGAASKRHRVLWLVTTACVLASGASGIADLHWPKAVVGALWLAGLVLIFLLLYLIQRDSREPILAAARAWRDNAKDKPSA